MMKAMITGLVTLVATATVSCSATPSTSRLTTIVTPSRKQFIGDATGSVSTFLEVRCASLDCHGSIGRPLRIYSGAGLRLPPTDGGASNAPGGSGTTVDEQNANFDTVVGLQPEQMSRVAASHGAQDQIQLLYLVMKPLGDQQPTSSSRGIQHKGGHIFSIGDPGYQCLVSWLESQGDYNSTDLPSCAQASQIGN